MADLSPHHGSRVFDLSGQWLDIRVANASVIHLSGTAPDADNDVYPLNNGLTFIKGPNDYAKIAKLGKRGTLRRQMEMILAQGGTSQLGAYVYINRVAEGADHNATIANIAGDRFAYTGVHSAAKYQTTAGMGDGLFKPRIFIAPEFTHSLSTDGIRSVGMDANGGGYSANTTMTATGGGGRNCVLEPVIVDGAITGAIVRKPGFGFTGTPTITIADPGPGNGIAGGSGATAEAVLGTVGNPIAHEYEGLCAQFRAVGFVDGPCTTDEAAVLARECYGSDRLYMMDGHLRVEDTALAAYVPTAPSGIFAGVQCRTDRDQGFVKSLSNELINGTDGLVRPVHYPTQTNYLNTNRVATVHNYGYGLRTWGNRTTSGMFLSVRRTRDLVNEAVETAYLRAVDRTMDEINIRILEEVGTDFLKTMENRRYVMTGSSEMRISRTKNSKGQMRQGRTIFDMRYEVPPPMEDITIEADDNINAYDLLVERMGRYTETNNRSVTSLLN
jgi:uncharacterized protein